MIGLSTVRIDPAGLLAGFIADSKEAGGIVSFTGVVRGSNEGGDVSALRLDFHERLTPAALEAIAEDAHRRFALTRIAIVHRVGDVEPGEPIVFVAAAALHRRAAFDAVDFAMDKIKIEAPFWKCEMRDGVSHWIEASPEDHEDRARWEHELGR